MSKNNKNQSKENKNPADTKNNNAGKGTTPSELKEKFSLKKLFQKIPFLSIAFWGMSAMSIAAIVIFAIALGQGANSSKQQYKECNDFPGAKAEFEKRTEVKDWFQEGIKLPDTLLFVNTDQNAPRFIVKANGQKTEIAFTNSRAGNSVKHIETTDSVKFSGFIARNFSIEENDNATTIAEKIGATTDYIADIKNLTNRYDIIFSLIYNTIVGDNKGHIAVTIENKKLKIITAKDFVWGRIDADLFIKSMNWVASHDTLSNKDKFILASSEKLSNAQQTDVLDTTEKRFKQFFGDDKAVQMNRKLPVDFLYYDFRKNVLHIGINEFANSDKKTQQYLPRLKFSPEEVFYITDSDTTLCNLSNFNSSTDRLLWGKIDSSKLAAGKFTTTDFANDYGVVKTWGKAFLLYLAVVVLLLYIVFIVFYWFVKGRKNGKTATSTTITETSGEKTPTNTENEFDLSSLTEEEKAVFNKIKPQFDAIKVNIERQNSKLFNQKVEETKELRHQLDEKDKEIESLCSKNQQLTSNNNALQSKIDNALQDFKNINSKDKQHVLDVLKTYDRLLTRNSHNDFTNTLSLEKEKYLSDFKKKENFDMLKEHDKIYTKLANSKKEKDILALLDELRKDVKDLPEIESLKKIYTDLSKDEKGSDRTKDNIISDLLARIDEYAKGKELTSQFDNYKKQTEEYATIKSTYNNTQKQIDDFYNLCSKLQKKDNPDFWDRTALSVWAISQLAIPLLRIWKKEIWFNDKADNIIETLKSDLLQIYTTRHFLRDTNEAKTLDDFKNALDNEIPQKLAEYTEFMQNVKIDANLKIQLTAALEKIKKFDSTQEFNNKMWNNFVKEFLEKAPTTDDKAWFFEQLFNIAYHTADYLDFIKNNKEIINCYNYQYLHNNFDLSKTNYLQFLFNYASSSTKYSNRIFKWADELGIKQLKVLIEKYLVKP
jgi:hypothetical protein